MQQLSPQDAMFAYMETANTPLQIGWLNVYDPAGMAPEARHLAILDHIAARLHTVRFFRERLVHVPGNLDRPYWVEDENFDLEYHLRHAAVPPPGDWQQLRTLVARLFARPFDFNRPLWEFWVIDGLDAVDGFPAGSFAILAKIHHCAVDGVSGADVTTFLHTPEPDTPPPAKQTWQPEPVPTQMELLLRSGLNRMANRGGLKQTIVEAMPGLKRVRAAIDAGELRKPARHKVPWTPFSGSVGPHRAFDARRFRIDELRAIRRLVPGATVNDVLLTVVGGALRRYLAGREELPGSTLVASCPISVRSEEQRGAFGNKIANMFIGLGTDLGDPVERLRTIRDETGNTKAMNEAIGAKTLAKSSEMMPGALVGLASRLSSRLSLSDKMAASANTAVTNVPGPQQPLYLAGARMLSQFGLGTVLDGMGVFHFILSYCGEVTLTVTGDRDKLADPAAYLRCIGEAYDELIAAAQAGKRAVPARA